MKGSKKDTWDKAHLILSVLIPAMLAGLGYVVTSAISQSEQVIKEANKKIAQAGAISSFLDPLTNCKNETKQLLAIEGVILALGEEGRKLAEGQLCEGTKEKAQAVLDAAPKLNGQTCSTKSDCFSGYCYPGPDVTGKNYCLAKNLNCAFPKVNGFRYDDVALFEGDEYQCHRPSSGLARWKKL